MTSDSPAPDAAQCMVVENVMTVLGRAWAGPVIEALLAGQERFARISRSIPAATDSVLSARLKELCTHGLVERRVAVGPPTVVSYHLTAAGRDVAPVLEAVRQFGVKHPRVGGEAQRR